VAATRAQPSEAVQALYREQPAAAPPEVPVQPEAAPEAPVQPEPETPSIDVDSLVAKAQQELGKAELDAHPVPLLDALSQQRKDSIPSLFYSRHDYAGPNSSAVSELVINGKVVREGDTAAAGVRLDQVLPDSAVFSHNGEQFRLRALNSWVNL
jgi:hypothetical protein